MLVFFFSCKELFNRNHLSPDLLPSDHGCFCNIVVVVVFYSLNLCSEIRLPGVSTPAFSKTKLVLKHYALGLKPEFEASYSHSHYGCKFCRLRLFLGIIWSMSVCVIRVISFDTMVGLWANFG